MDLKNVDTEEIIRRLREFAPNLPDSGFAAGGAVAAVINHIVRGVDSPIRDVDIFLPADFDSRGNNDQQFIWTDVGFYSGMLEDVGYSLIRTERDYNLDLVYCTASIDGFESNILKGFDLNCCQSGINLSTGELFYTTEFEDFLKSGKIYITNVCTPFHSACRLFKKTRDMSGNCSYDTELHTLSLSLHLLTRWTDVLSQQIPLNKLSFLTDQDKAILRRFFIIEEQETSFKISVIKMDKERLFLSEVGICTSVMQFMAKIKALRKGHYSILFLLDEPIAYRTPHYLDNYRDVTLGDLENRRDNNLAMRMGWNIRQHCQYSRHAQFTSEINKKVDPIIRQPAYSSVAAALQPKDEAKPDLNQNRTSSPDNTRQPIATGPSAVTAQEILRMLSSPPPIEDRSPLNQLRNNNLFGISLQSAINNGILEHFARRRGITG